MSVHVTAYTTPSQSTTGTRKRSVADFIRRNFPGNVIQALVSNGIASGKDVVRKKGFIGKRAVEDSKFEVFIYSPQAISFTVASITSATQFILSASDGLTVKMGLWNTRTKTSCRIATRNSSTHELVVVSVGDTTFDVAADDVLIALGPAYAENSSSPYILMKDPDNTYNFTQIFRYTCAISNSAKSGAHYGGDRWAALKEENGIEGMRKTELSLLFGNRPSSTNESTSDSTLGDAFRTTRGVWNWGQTELNMGGSVTAEKWLADLPAMMHETMGTGLQAALLCGRLLYGQFCMLGNDVLRVEQTDSGELSALGLRPKKLVTGNGDIDLYVHDAFDRGNMSKTALLMVPELLDFVHLKDRDFKIKENIQNNDVDGRQDEILGEVGICPRDGGYSIHRMLNCVA